MKILLAAVNAKYIHMNPALYSIRAFMLKGEDPDIIKNDIEIAEYTINQYPKEVLTDIYEKHPDVIGFSCYIWNMNFISELLADIKKILPEVFVFLGGPEVSYNKENVLDRFAAVDGVFYGEGERTWKEAVKELSIYGRVNDAPAGLLLRKDLPMEKGDALKSAPSVCAAQPTPALMNLDDIPFFYDDLSVFDNRMLYYETSRGCPYRCSYCLSSIDKTMRFRSLDKVYQELSFFLEHNVKIVKFIDRTFNADHHHAMGIWQYLNDHDNGVTRFHFEIEADILTEEEIAFLKTVRKGLFQFEIGVQSVNRQTLDEINRHAKTEKIKRVVTELGSVGNIPLHVDLIAGLPFEDLTSFIHSFNEVYSWKADELQLGFLKVLHGTLMEEKASQYGVIYEENPPYEVLGSKWLSYQDIVFLKEIEDQLERYGNSKAFCHTLACFERFFETPFAMYNYIAEYYKENLHRFNKQSRASSYEMLKKIIEKRLSRSLAADHFDALLIMDLYEREKLKTRPGFLKGKDEQHEKERLFIKENQLQGKNVHVEFFDFDVDQFEKTGEIVSCDCRMVFVYEGQGEGKLHFEKENIFRVKELSEL